MSSTAIVNIGTVLSGRLDSPVHDADTVLVERGRITAVGSRSELDIGDVPVVDARGTSLAPGLIDNHVHPVIGDFTPRQQQINYLEGFVHGGVTTVVSAGEPHTPGRPKDRVGTKALALLVSKAFSNMRPGGLKVHAGALLLEDGLVEQDFHELAEAGVRLVGEIGISGVQDPQEAGQMARWAQAAGMTVMVHVGGKSVPTSRAIDAEFVVAVQPDIAAHVNGGPTAPKLSDVQRILDETDAFVEVVHNGNVRAARDVVRLVAERGELHRLVLGTDSPAGTGVVPLGMLRTLAWAAALADVPAPEAFALATGNTARARRLDAGVIAVGAPADLVLLDAPDGGQSTTACGALERGDTLAVAAVLIDGEIVARTSRNTPPPLRSPSFPD